MENQIFVIGHPEIYKMDKEEEPLSYEDTINKAASAIYRFPLVEVQGIPLMSWIAHNWSSVWAFRPDPSDLLISTYPKAGKNTESSQTRTSLC